MVYLIRQRVLGRTLLMVPEFFWQVPLADALVFLLFGLLYALAGLVMAPLRSPRILLGAFGFVATLAVFLLFERIHLAVEFLFALPIGAALARGLSSRDALARRGFRLAAPTALLLLGLTGLGQHFLRANGERRALAALAATITPRPNILLLVLDTVRAGNLALPGYGRATMPGLRGRAA